MHLFNNLKKLFSREPYSAQQAQQLAHIYSWGPALFQVARLMGKYGILEMLNEAPEGLTQAEIQTRTKLSEYAVKCLLEASLSIGTVLINAESDRYTISKTGWFLLNDPATKVNIDFNHDVNYMGWFHLEEALREGRPAGLKHFGDWPTVYEGLSSLPKQVQDSWFGFDHFYSDSSFAEALQIVFAEHNVRTLYDVGGNTGRWALQCVDYDKEVEVTILDLPQQIGMMQENVAGKPGADRIKGQPVSLSVRMDLTPSGCRSSLTASARKRLSASCGVQKVS